MKILFVQSYLGGRKEPPVMPLGIAYLSAMVPEHEVRVVDLNLCTRPYEELTGMLKKFAPEAVCVSLRNIDSQQRKDLIYYYLEFPKTLEIIRKTLPHAVIIAGGAGFSMFAQKIMERQSEIDFGVYLEGEEVFPALLDNLGDPSKVHNIYYKKEGKVLFSRAGGLPDFRSLPISRKDVLAMDVYKKNEFGIGIQTKRGCPCTCVYCNYPMLNGLQVRMREPAHIVDEIEELVGRYDVDSFMFADGVFSSPLSHAIDTCEEIRRRKLRVKWTAWCDVKDICEEFLRAATSAGCKSVVISPDALSDGALNGLRKGFAEKDVRRVFKILKKWPGIRFDFGFFINAPGETLPGLLKTLLFFTCEKIDMMIKGKGGGGVNWIRIEPGTMIYDIAMKEGVITPGTDLLPENEEELKNVFYIAPGMRNIDPLAFAFVKGLGRMKRFLVPGGKVV